MSRSRMIGTIASLTIAAGLVAGCGGGGYTAAEEAPTTTAPATAPPATPLPATASGGAAPAAADGTTKALGAYPAADPVQATIKSFDQFRKSRAGEIFTEPASVRAASTSGGGTTTTPPTGGPASPTSPVSPIPVTPTTPTTTNPTPTKTTATYTAQIDVNGANQVAKVGDQVPTTDPQFTVQAIAKDKVTLKVNTGTFPGGGTTVDIQAGASVTLSNPTTGAALTVKVVTITPAA